MAHQHLYTLALSLALSWSTVVWGTPTHGTQNLFFDFPEFKIGHATLKKGPTGCTVLYFPKGGLAAIDVRGGAAATREQSSIEEGNSWGWVDAVVLAGGSTYGLATADGVMKEILKARKNSTHFNDIPAVPAAVVYDFAKRNNARYPNSETGAEAFRNARSNQVTLGAVGAGANIKVGSFFGSDFSERSGLGAAFFQNSELKIFALSAVNAMGNVLSENGEVLAGSKDPKSGKRISITDSLLKSKKAAETMPLGNTTLSVIVTNAPLDRGELKRVAIMAHTSMARAIDPFHSPSDGDTLFVVSTVTEPHKRTQTPNLTEVGAIAGGLLQEAVRSAVRTVQGPQKEPTK